MNSYVIGMLEQVYGQGAFEHVVELKQNLPVLVVLMHYMTIQIGLGQEKQKNKMLLS